MSLKRCCQENDEVPAISTCLGGKLTNKRYTQTAPCLWKESPLKSDRFPRRCRIRESSQKWAKHVGQAEDWWWSILDTPHWPSSVLRRDDFLNLHAFSRWRGFPQRLWFLIPKIRGRWTYFEKYVSNGWFNHQVVFPLENSWRFGIWDSIRSWRDLSPRSRLLEELRCNSGQSRIFGWKTWSKRWFKHKVTGMIQQT